MKPVHSQSVDEALMQFGVDLGRGLDSTEAASRLETHGENRLADVDRRPAWKRFADQFKDFLIAILFVAAVVSLFVSGDVKTPIVVLVVVMLNAVIGFVQENRAESSLEALKKMLTANTRVRRNLLLRSSELMHRLEIARALPT
jgi:Ca2+-transporting ATPase